MVWVLFFGMLVGNQPAGIDHLKFATKEDCIMALRQIQLVIVQPPARISGGCFEVKGVLSAKPVKRESRY